MTYHAHIDSAARDCDGLYTRDHVMSLSALEGMQNDNGSGDGDYAFESRVLRSVVSLTGFGGTLTVIRGDVDNGEGWTRMEWSEATDEGYRNIDVRFCRDDCDDAVSHFRDHTAEAAGY